MIARYTRAEMGELWSQESKFEHMLMVEKAVASVQAQLGIIPKAAARAIASKSRFKISRIQKIEETTKHDVIAFVSAVAENVGPYGRYIHYGMTSSDVIDTALSLQVQKAGGIIKQGLKKLDASLVKQVKKHKKTLCSGRTHGMHAEPTSFGLKLCGFLMELRRNQVRFHQALEGMRVGKLSGAVGTYSTQGPVVEKKVCQKLKLKPEPVATQVIPRDRHAELIAAVSFIGNGLERLAVELRHLQRTEVNEVIEGFTPGQKGSSAMPHKKNPISAENITGASRLLRSYAVAAAENVALWHERDISHSSVERVIFPDAFILLDYILHRMTQLMDRLYVNKEQMLINMNRSGGQLFSSHVLLELVQQGLSREEAYRHVQRVSHGLQKDENLKEQLLKDKQLKDFLTKARLESIFSGQTHMKSIVKVVDRALRE